VSTAVARQDRARARWRGFADWATRSAQGLRVAARMTMGRGHVRVFDRLTRVAPARPVGADDLARLLAAELGVLHVGHATMLLRVGGRTILTDPVFSRRVGIGWVLGTAGPARLVAPAVSLASLPPVDVVLLTHAHLDHLDRPSLWRIARRHRSARVIVSRGNADLVGDLPFARVDEVDVGGSVTMEGEAPAELRAPPVPAGSGGASPSTAPTP